MLHKMFGLMDKLPIFVLSIREEHYQPKKTTTMNLFFNYIVKREEDMRSHKDRRFKVIRVVASYTGEDNQEYRKGFECKTEPIIPNRGTHEQLNKLKIQY